MRERAVVTGMWMMVVVAMTGGCQPQGPTSGGQRAPAGVDIVDRIEILSLPVAINLDNLPGPDGLRVQVYLFQYAQAEPVVAAGTLEFLLFDRKLSTVQAAAAEPVQTWSFDPGQASRYLARSMIGWNYSMELRWQGRRPASETVTLLVRYLPPAGQPVYSSPVMIAMGAK